MGTIATPGPTLMYMYSNMYSYIQIRKITGKGTRRCDASELEFSVGVSSTISCSSKRFNVARERGEATLFYYSQVNVRANVN